MNALKIDETVYRQARAKAAIIGRPLNAVLEQLLRDWLELPVTAESDDRLAVRQSCAQNT